MSGDCLSCGSLVRDGQHYRCDALRLRNPAGALEALPSRLCPCDNRAFEFPELPHIRSVTRVTRWMAPGPVEGWRIELTGEKVPMAYSTADCPAWRP